MNAAMNRHYAIPPNLSHVWYLSWWLVNLIVCKLESGVRSLLCLLTSTLPPIPHYPFDTHATQNNYSPIYD